MRQEILTRGADMKKVVIVAFVVFLGAAAYYFLTMRAPENAGEEFSPVILGPDDAAETGQMDASAPPATGLDPADGINAAPAPEIALLPDLTASDPLVLEALAGLVGQAAVDQYLVPENIISRVVATVDALGGRRVPEPLMPVQPLPSGFEANVDFDPGVPLYNPLGDELPQYLVDPVSYARYAPYVDLLNSVNMAELAAIYQQQQPLFQQAYVELGYPDGDFKLRLLEVIDLLLATPAVTEPVRLLKPEAYYLFADPELEALPAGARLMIRMGNDNAGQVKAKLEEFRAAIAGTAAANATSP
jgi:hypothetical protein